MERKLIENLGVPTLNELNLDEAYRSKKVRIIDCGNNVFGKHCPLDNTRLYDDHLQKNECRFGHDLTINLPIWNFNYGSKLSNYSFFFLFVKQIS